MCEGLETDEKLMTCDECGNILTYKGLGEYFCPICERTFYNDYGKVRAYLEVHPGATMADVSTATNVPRGVIRRLIEQDKITENTIRAISI